jgi:hypothetical protein
VFNTTGSTYDWTRVDTLLTWATTNSKRIIYKLAWKNFESSVGLIAPADLIAANTVATSSGFIACVWRSAVMDRFIAAVQAFAARYDNHPLVEFITYSESATSNPVAADYNKDTYATQLGRLTTASAAAFVHTLSAVSLNSLTDKLSGLMEGAYQAGIGMASADAHDSIAETMFRGATYPGELAPVRDYRGLMPHHTIASQPTLGGKDDNGPPSNINTWAQGQKVTHLSWYTQISTGVDSWTNIKAEVDARPNLLYSSCPGVLGPTPTVSGSGTTCDIS